MKAIRACSVSSPGLMVGFHSRGFSWERETTETPAFLQQGSSQNHSKMGQLEALMVGRGVSFRTSTIRTPGCASARWYRATAGVIDCALPHTCPHGPGHLLWTLLLHSG